MKNIEIVKALLNGTYLSKAEVEEASRLSYLINKEVERRLDLK